MMQHHIKFGRNLDFSKFVCMRLTGYILFVVFLLLVASNSFATKVTATQNGNWTNTSTWGGNAVPDGTPCYDSIVIPAGITVICDGMINLTGCPATKVFVYGALNFATGKKLDLAAGSFVYVGPAGGLQTGGGGGNSNLITIGGTSVWSAGCGGASPPPDCGTFLGTDILCVGCSLPIELVDFTATMTGDVVALNWQTASETQNDFFWVQRSVDGLNWEDLIWHDGAGNSSTLISYTDEDRAPLLGLSYYRLKQVDLNGAHSYSETRVVTNGQFSTSQQLLVLQNEFGNSQNVVIYFSEEIQGEVEIIFTGMSGSVVLSKMIALENEKWVVINLNAPLAAGIYVVKANRLIEKVFFQ